MKQPNELANYLDQVLPPHSTITPILDQDPLVDAAVQLALDPLPELDEERMRQIQARILAPYQARRRFQTLRILRIAIAASLILIFGVTAAGAASLHSLPGSPLYPIKRSMEQGQLAFVDDQREVDLRLEFADRRLDEFETLLDRGDIRVETLADAGEDLNRALDLVERGSGSPDQAADVITLSERQSQLALDARVQLAPDAAQQARLDAVVYNASQISTTARYLFDTPPILTTVSPDDTIIFIMPME